MDIRAYRKRVESDVAKAAQRPTPFGAQLAKRGRGPTPPVLSNLIDAAEGAGDFAAGLDPHAATADASRLAEAERAVDVLGDPETGPAPFRVSAVQAVVRGIAQRPELMSTLIEVLQDRQEDQAVRLAALTGLQQVEISAPRSAADRPRYLDALRSIIDDPDATIRRRAIGILAREKDSAVQERLLSGLTGQSRPLVPAAKAVQLLGYDVHAMPSALFREIVQRPPSAAAKREAVRALAADPASEDLLVSLLEDRSERSDIRRIAAVAVHWLDPARFAPRANRIIADASEDPDVRATVITALTSEGRRPEAAGTELTDTVRDLAQGSSSSALKRAAKAYLAVADR